MIRVMALKDDETKPETISNQNEIIVALRGDELFWYKTILPSALKEAVMENNIMVINNQFILPSALK